MNDSSIKVSVDEEAKILTNYTINNSYDSNTYRGSYTIYLCLVDRENMIERGNFINDEELMF